MRIRLEYVQGERVVAEDDSVNAFYVDDTQISDEVAEEVTRMWNSDMPLDEIDKYLMNNETVIQDDREEIIEGLYNIEKPKV